MMAASRTLPSSTSPAWSSPSLMIPFMPAQVSVLASSPSATNDCSNRVTCCRVSFRCLSSALMRSLLDEASTIFGIAFVRRCSASYRSRSSLTSSSFRDSMEAMVEIPPYCHRLNASALATALALLPGHLRSFLARLAQPDRDRLFPASDLPARSALESPLLLPMHGRLHAPAGCLSVFSHAAPICKACAEADCRYFRRGSAA